MRKHMDPGRSGSVAHATESCLVPEKHFKFGSGTVKAPQAKACNKRRFRAAFPILSLLKNTPALSPSDDRNLYC